MKPSDFAQLRGVSQRTVERWLRDGELPEARKGPDGRWSIPADAMRQTPLPGTDMSPARRDMTGPTSADMSPARRDMSGPQSIAELLAVWPAFLSLEQAEQALGIPAAAIRRHRERFDAEPWGAHGALVVPARVVRAFAGL